MLFYRGILSLLINLDGTGTQMHTYFKAKKEKEEEASINATFRTITSAMNINQICLYLLKYK